MSQELHYTSVPRGLKPGSRGFGTVAATGGLSEALADRLEALSAYQAVYPPGDPSAALNPVAFVHVRLTVAGYVQDVLSRIGPAGLDYSGRPNKYAHHVILEPDERPEGGPAWLLGRPGFVRESWEGEPRILDEGPVVPRGDRPAGIARAWLGRTGDAGWAGVLAETFLADPRRPVFLVFRPGMDLLPLFVEAIALLPAARRWDVEFSTYLTTLPPGVSCTWRGVLEGSAPQKAARRLPNALIVDLCRPLGRASGGRLVHLARTGERLDVDEPDATGPPGPPRPADAPSVVRAGPPPRLRDPGGRTAPGPHDGRDWLPDLATALAEDELSLLGDRPRGRPKRRRLLPLGILAGLLAPAIALVVLSPSVRRQLGLESSVRPVASRDLRPRPATVPTAPRDTPPPPTRPTPKPSAAGADDAETDGMPPTVAKAPTVAPTTIATRPTPRPAGPPLILAFATPAMTGSSLGASNGQGRAIRLPEDSADRLEILNGAGLRLAAVPGAASTWEIALRTGSGLGGGSALARLHRGDPRTWQWTWARGVRPRSDGVERLKDAVLGLRGRQDRPIYVLLRGVERDSERPLVIWKGQPILFDKLDPRIKPVAWAGDPDPLAGSRWKVRIRRWRAVLSRAEAGADGEQPPGRVIEPAPVAASGADSALEADLVPGEVKLRLAIVPDDPGLIDVRVEPDAAKFRAGRAARASRRDELKKATPRDKDGNEGNPLESRRVQLARLRAAAARNGDAIKALEKEVAELEKIEGIRVMEELLTRPARLELSAVIGLDVEGPGILEIVRIGAFAGGR